MYLNSKRTYRHTDNGTFVTFKNFQTFTGLEVPAPDRAVRGSGEQYLAGLVDSHACHGARVFCEGLQRLARLERPRYRREVGGTGH